MAFTGCQSNNKNILFNDCDFTELEGQNLTDSLVDKQVI